MWRRLTSFRGGRPLWLAAGVVVCAVVGGAILAGRPTGPRVLVIGDSLVTQSRPDLLARLEADGWRPTVVGLNGRTVAEVATETRELRGRRWDAVAVWAGHNDAIRLRPWGDPETALLEWAGGQRCAAVMEIKEGFAADLATREGRPPPRAAIASAINAHLRALAGRDADVRLVPWAETAQRRGLEILDDDLLHVNRAGGVVAAAAMADALLSCPTAP